MTLGEVNKSKGTSENQKLSNDHEKRERPANGTLSPQTIRAVMSNVERHLLNTCNWLHHSY